MITVNQREQIAWRQGMTVSGLLDQLRYTFPRVVVSINGVLVSTDVYDDTLVPDHADVRIIHLMAGG